MMKHSSVLEVTKIMEHTFFFNTYRLFRNKSNFFLQFDGNRIALNTNEFLQEKQQNKVITAYGACMSREY